MRLWKNLNKNEKLMVIMLIVSLLLVIISWDRIKNQTVRVFNYYMEPTIEYRKE